VRIGDAGALERLLRLRVPAIELHRRLQADQETAGETDDVAHAGALRCGVDLLGQLERWICGDEVHFFGAPESDLQRFGPR